MTQPVEALIATVVEEVRLLQATNDLLRQEVLRLCTAVATLQGKPQPKGLISSKECQSLMGWKSHSTLVRWRSSEWLEGIHYFPQGNQKSSPILYCPEAISHWQKHHQSDPGAHRRYCEKLIKEKQVA